MTERARWTAGLSVALALVGACASDETASPVSRAAVTSVPATVLATNLDLEVADADDGSDIVTLPRQPDVTLPAAVSAAADQATVELRSGGVRPDTVAKLISTGDRRVGWLLSDMMRFAPSGFGGSLLDGFKQLFADDAAAGAAYNWTSMTNVLIELDVPPPPRYRGFKAQLFLAADQRWESIFTDFEATIDWRYLTWGGVYPDRRPLGTVGPCAGGCIPANDDPPLVPATEGSWYPDDRIVFGVVIDEQVVAFPKHFMEVHEMVNVTIGGRRLAIAYCTLCGSAQAFFTDRVPGQDEPLVMRTSGLLYLSNKVMFDLNTNSAFDTFLGRAITGDLHLDEVTLPMATVVSSTWGEWKREHPDTTIVAADGGWGHTYSLDPLGGRDDDGPIFPIRQSDTRLPIDTLVLGATAADGTAVAFPVDAAKQALAAGDEVSFGELRVIRAAGGLAVLDGDAPVASHEARWFAWAQFRPATALWEPPEPPDS